MPCDPTFGSCDKCVSCDCQQCQPGYFFLEPINPLDNVQCTKCTDADIYIVVVRLDGYGEIFVE